MTNIQSANHRHIGDIDLDSIKNIYKYYQTAQMDFELKNLLNRFGIQCQDVYDLRQYINDLIYEAYPNENVIKSSFINNVLMKSNDHVSIFELSVANSRTDLCKINGNSIAYEIKTQYDNYNRLSKQINDYLSVFEMSYVICPKSNIDQIEKEIPDECGIYFYCYEDRNYKFIKHRKAKKSICLNPTVQLSVLTKRELSIHFNIKSSKENREQIVIEILNKYSPKYINSMFKKSLKQKYFNNWMFLKEHHEEIYNIDYQWFFKQKINPNIIYLIILSIFSGSAFINPSTPIC